MMSGQQIGPYRVLEGPFLGGFSAVYKVFDSDWGDEYALKMLRSPSYITAAQRSLFEHEIALWLELPPHRHVVRIHRAFDYETSPCILMEWVGGGGLDRRIAALGQQGISGSNSARQVPLIRLVEALCLMYDAALGLHHVHSHGVVHGDLKPSNILLKYGSTPMISDFGFSHLTGLEPGLPGAGTPQYMAPEQFWGAPTAQSDLFSIGLVFKEIIDALALVDRADDRAAPVIAMIDSMIQPDPLDRPGSVLPVIQAFDRVMPDLYKGWAPFDPGPAGSQPYTNLPPTLEEKTLADALPERYLVQQARTRFTAGDLDPARALALQALDRRPAYPGALIILAEIAVRQDDAAAARQWLAQVRRACAGNAVCSYNAAALYFQLDDLESAEAVLHELAAFPDYPKVEADAVYSLGKIHARRGSVSDAIDCYRKSLALRGSSEAKLGLAIQLGEAGLLDEAIRLARELQADPRLDKRARINLARLYTSDQQFDAALNLLNKLLEEGFDPQATGYILSEIGYAYLLQERFQEAAGYYERCLQIDPHDSVAQRQLNICRARSGG